MSRLDDVTPVGYRFNNFIGDWHISTSKPEPEWDYKKVEPLYTRDQLMPKVKMTRDQKSLIVDYKNAQSMFVQFVDLIKISGTYKIFNNISEEELMLAWISPDDKIEIIKDKKWFVVSRERDEDSDYVFVSDINEINYFGYTNSLEYLNSPKCTAHAFNTEEEANLWVTPKMHAVELEVE